MKKIIICIVLTIILISCEKGNRTINVTGQGSVTFVPNILSFSVTVKNIDMKLDNALSATKNTIDKILRICKKHNIDELDIKTSYINTKKEYTWDSKNRVNIFSGYSATQTTQLVIRDLQSLEVISSELFNLDIASINDFIFDHSDRQKFEAEARLLALDNANIIASKIAEKMNVTLAQVQLVSDSFYNNNSSENYYGSDYAPALSESGISASPGILTIEKNIQVIYGIK